MAGNGQTSRLKRNGQTSRLKQGKGDFEVCQCGRLIPHTYIEKDGFIVCSRETLCSQCAAVTATKVKIEIEK